MLERDGVAAVKLLLQHAANLGKPLCMALLAG